MIAALVPAAGSSSRMGRPKLLLEMEGQSLIGRVVTALRSGGAAPVVVVVPPAQAAEGPAVAAEAQFAGAFVVVPDIRPHQMRDSIEIGLNALARQGPPRSVVLMPGDYPGITAEFVARLLEYAAEKPDRIVIPSHNGRRGHPIVLPWSIATEIHALPAGVGVNALVAKHGQAVLEFDSPSPEIVVDLDTPDDVQQWIQRRNAGRRSSEGSGMQVSDSSVQIANSKFQRSDPAGPPSGTGFRVLVRLFALAKDRAGQPDVEIELDHGSTVRDLRAALAENRPALAPLLSTAMIAVDEEYAGDDTPIMPGSRLAIIPPVSGGAGVIR